MKGNVMATAGSILTLIVLFFGGYLLLFSINTTKEGKIVDFNAGVASLWAFIGNIIFWGIIAIIVIGIIAVVFWLSTNNG